MMIFGYILMLIAILLAVSLFNEQKSVETKKEIAKPFDKKWANLLYRYSYHAPFVWFLDETESDKKAKDLKTRLASANATHLFNYRSYMTLKTMILLFAVVVFSLLLLILSNGGIVSKVLFNIENVTESQGTFQIKIVALMILMLLVLIPNFILKQREKIYATLHLKDIPIVQLFIILMLRSKKPVNEILYALARINTRYKGIFESGYRIYIRNKEEGLDYIQDCFGETHFKETINVLRDLGEYSREDSITLLENNMQKIVELNNSNKRRADIASLVYSQSTMVVPYVALITLCFVPLVVYGLKIFNSGGMGF